ncbi:hypothetical protein Q8A57_08410 [Porticoccus litoralis]|uniref:Tetratricopeptide repeat protein n=1 Tax=Porticoccus litoralis TaxID=434086 RepID=A0AAW8B504_9GAMM|nr:hypothetical protein [Porticoccus litoralis]MDP1520988.1 hypothetical protein [Porticoccus litoralis]
MADSNDFEPIKPAEFPLTQNTLQPGEPVPWQQRRSTWVALAICVLLALLVIFVLPALVPTPKGPPVAIETGNSQAPALSESPFRDAQLGNARRAAQDVLAKILEKKSFLEQKNIQQWGASAMTEALKAATEGDRFYQQRDFPQAQARYEETLSNLQALEDSIPQRLAAALTTGNTFLSESHALKAQEQFELALAIDPDNREAEIGLSRATVLDQVTDLLNQADLAVQNSELERARQLFNQIISLDALSNRARDGLQQVTQQISQQAFNEAMSRGFNALESNQLTKARTAFNEALKIQPDSDAARKGLAQTGNRSTQQSIQSLMTKAEQQETDEQWHSARDSYAKTLTIDSSLMAARLGQLRSGARADLEDRIMKILNDPLRLSTASVRKQATQVLQDARGIKNPGPRLREQISRLQKTIQTAVTPLTIEFLSDNDTHVTLYKVGELGQFNRKQLELIPGNYVAVGSRSGYRDVRVEFQITATSRDKPVIIVCTEPVS